MQIRTRNAFSALNVGIGIAVLTASALVLPATSVSGDAYPVLPGRIPITQLPYTISSPGSYYLIRTLTGTAGNKGIIVNASNVTIDLNGYALSGVPASDDGIHLAPTTENVTIVNGTIEGWGFEGIDGSSSLHLHVQNVRLFRNVQSGVHTGINGLVEDCAAYDNGSFGIKVGAGSLVRDCTASENTNDGIHAEAGGNLIERCVSRDNGADGIHVFGGQSIVQDCVATSNPQFGILVQAGDSLVRGNVSRQNALGNYLTAGCTMVENH